MGVLTNLPNIGQVIESQLNEIDILTCEQLKMIGSRQVWLKIRGVDDSACFHKLCALEGAVRGIKKSQLPPEVKADLKEFYNSFKL